MSDVRQNHKEAMEIRNRKYAEEAAQRGPNRRQRRMKDDRMRPGKMIIHRFGKGKFIRYVVRQQIIPKNGSKPRRIIYHYDPQY